MNLNGEKMTSVFTSLYKTRASTQYATTQERMEVTDNYRRESRWTALSQRRNIATIMSPINSPHVSAKKIDKSIVKTVKNDRLEQLMKWKDQKKKKLAAIKANSKPIFKVCRVKESLRPDLNEIYGKIKGKETSFKLAPSSTYKFKPPSNVKPLNMKAEHTNPNVKQRLNFKEDLVKEANISLKHSGNSYSAKMKSHNDNSKKKNTSNNSSVIKVGSLKKPSINNTMMKPKSPKVMVDIIEEKIHTSGSISKRKSIKKLKNTKVEMINVAEETILSSEQRITTNNSTKRLKSPKVKAVDVIEEMTPTSGSISTSNSMQKRKNAKLEMLNVAEETIPSSDRRINTNNSTKKMINSNVKMVDVMEEMVPTSESITSSNSMQKRKNTKVEMINVVQEIIPSSEQRMSTNNSTKRLKSPKVKTVDVIEEMTPTSGSKSTSNSMQKRKNTKAEMINVAEETIASSEQRISTDNSMKKLNSPKAQVATLTEETIITPVKKVHTPIQSKNNPVGSQVVYISPFITISRGKENSRREYHERRSNFYESPTMTALQKNTTPKAGAAFFENLLREEEQRLNELCTNWQVYKDSENPPEEACDMIRMAIGQTKLLLRKKFGKFMELISECRCPTSEKMVTCLDLHGFWDITKIQINNLDGRFENLDRLKSSNWEEIVPPPLSKKQRRPKKNNVKKKEVKSSLRDLIKEQRKKNDRKANKNSPMIVVTTPHRRLLNISNTTFPQSDASTPFHLRTNTPKSILKSGHFPKDRSIRKTKSVLFRESMGKENILDSSNLIQFSPNPETSLRQYPRRSSRLAEKRINS